MTLVYLSNLKINSSKKYYKSLTNTSTIIPEFKVLIIDNYDSFTFNLYQLVGELNSKAVVYKNDEISIEDIIKIAPSHIIISPGPGSVLNKVDFGICEKVILKFMKNVPILGVCLGHQGIIKALGGKIMNAPEIMHGKTSQIEHYNNTLYKNVIPPFTAMRYHSLCSSESNFPKELTVTARSIDDNIIMGVEHCQHPLHGIQFHPESFMTDYGRKILHNFLLLCG